MGERGREDDLGANPTCQSAGKKGQVWGARTVKMGNTAKGHI